MQRRQQINLISLWIPQQLDDRLTSSCITDIDRFFKKNSSRKVKKL
jgi:hypothetical protein